MELHAMAEAGLARLRIAAVMVPSTEWFLFGFVRKEAVITSRIEGTQATLRDVVTYEATGRSERPDDVRVVCNYVDALDHARVQIVDPNGLPLSIRLLRDTHGLLMKGVRGEDNMAGEVRRSQNWIGGTRPGHAYFVPPPAEEVPEALSAMERWFHVDSEMPTLVRIGLAHAQFETIHPFLDGNGRIGRLLIALLVEHWGLLDRPLLYLSLAFRRNQQEYYARLTAVRTRGDWEGWTTFFLECVGEAAEDGVRIAEALHALVGRDRNRVLASRRATVAAVRLLEFLPSHPVVSVRKAGDLLGLTPPAARKAIELLENLGVLGEITGRRRDRFYAYHEYLDILTGDDA